jgi:hypothetical protein
MRSSSRMARVSGPSVKRPKTDVLQGLAGWVLSVPLLVLSCRKLDVQVHCGMGRFSIIHHLLTNDLRLETTVSAQRTSIKAKPTPKLA